MLVYSINKTKLIPKQGLLNFKTCKTNLFQGHVYSSSCHIMWIYIKLDKIDRSYSAGEDMTGRVILRSATRPTGLNEVRLQLVGRERLHFTQRPIVANIIQDPQIVTYSYSTLNTYGDGHMDVSYVYRFLFRLPKKLPSSFSTDLGEISYYLEAELFRKDGRTCLPVKIYGILDLNKVAVERVMPQDLVRMKGSNFLTNRRGNLGFCLQLPLRSGFVPGEFLELQACIGNNSNKTVNRVVASLIQTTSYKYKPYRGRDDVRGQNINKLIKCIRGLAVQQGQTKIWKPTNLIIPDVPPSGLGRGVSEITGRLRVIDIQYFLHFDMDVSGLGNSLSGKLPVVIGTIPLRSSSLTSFTNNPITISSTPSAPMMDDDPPLEMARVLPRIEIEGIVSDQIGLPSEPEVSLEPPRYDDVVTCPLQTASDSSGIASTAPPPYEEAASIGEESSSE